jgi:UDP-glucose 4-epimerase
MILVTGGLGFIGAHVARALLDLGATCVLTQHRSTAVPSFLRDDLDRRAFIVPLDLRDRAAVLALAERYAITGIVHLGGALSNPFDELRDAAAALGNVLEAAHTWRVARIAIASAIGVYGAANGTELAREDAVLPLAGSAHPIIAMKKSAEIYAELIAQRCGLELVVLRIGAIYGPRYRGMRTFLSRLVHAVVRDQPIDLTGVQWGAGPDDGGDWCHVGDCARGIALLQTAPALRHRIYNVSAGVATRNRELVAIARALAPAARTWASLPESVGATPPPAVLALDLARIRADTGYAPRFTAATGIADYLAWLAAGNDY